MGEHPAAMHHGASSHCLIPMSTSFLFLAGVFAQIVHKIILKMPPCCRRSFLT